MIFTRDQIEEIRKKLFEMGVTDLSMPEADTPLSGTEVISLVQNGVNKKINISDFWRRYASYFENERWEAYREAEQAREADYKSLKVMINDGERSRNQAEQERSANETARLDAEEDRYQAEIIRQQEFNTIKNQLEELIDEGGIGELNVQADWNEDNDTKDSYIKNKPKVYTQDQTDEAIRNAAANKADKVSSAVSGDIATLDANGNLTDSGKKVSDFAPQSSTYTKQEVDAAIEAIDVSSQISGKANKSEMSVSSTGDKTTITLKTGTSAEVINQHQDISGKQDVISDLAAIRSGAAAGATAVQPAAMNTALAGKQDTLTFDSTPTASSSNPVTSGGVKSALDAKADNGSVSALGNRVSTIEEELINLVGLNQSNFMGIFGEAQNLPSMSNSGWALVGNNMASLAVYVYYTTTSSWERYGNATYDYTDFSGLISRIENLEDKTHTLKEVTAEGFSVADGNGNIMLSVNNNGLDAAKLSSHFKSLVGSVGIYRKVTASGFSFADNEGNIMASINGNGLDAARVTSHFKSLVSGQTIDETNDDEVVEKYGLPMLDNMRAEVIEHNLNNRFMNFAFITDTHSEGTHQIFNLNAFKNMKLFRIFCNEKIVDFGLHCGDLYTDYGTSRKEALKLIDSSTQILCDVDCPMFFVKGNHDNNGKGRIEADITNLDWDNKIYSVAKVTNYGLKNASFTYERVYEDTWDGKSTLYEGYGVKSLNITKYQYYLLTQKLADSEVTRSSTDPYGAYYFKDYNELGIRIVVLNFYDREARDETLGYWEAGGLSATQLTWLNNIALNTENAVIVFSHWYNADLVSALSAFSNNGGELIALIHGHSHTDQYDNSGGINNIGVRNGFGIATEMIADQKKSFAFSVFTVDTENKILYETRLGNGVSRSFSYNTPSQIS